jgi:hypothetical protein
VIALALAFVTLLCGLCWCLIQGREGFHGLLRRGYFVILPPHYHLIWRFPINRTNFSDEWQRALVCTGRKGFVSGEPLAIQDNAGEPARRGGPVGAPGGEALAFQFHPFAETEKFYLEGCQQFANQKFMQALDEFDKAIAALAKAASHLHK